ncbi:MAG: DUF72 domain-containing protein [Elusimicrobia bacterium]|nr:DUF72 domain-containing protein [Candidatus Liberimonas magnetica]
MNTVKIGCCGFPLAQAKYYQNFNTIEINQTFYQLPELKTAKKWVEKAPKGFEFIVKAWQLITHPCVSSTYRRLREKIPELKKRYYGLFNQTDEVREAWRRTLEFGQILKAKIYLFQTPSSLRPTVDNITNLYKFFKHIHSRELTFIWEPRGEWNTGLITKICSDLNLIHCVDPLRSKPLYGHIRYYRLHGGYEEKRIVYDHKYKLNELNNLLKHADKPLNYFLFNNSNMWQDSVQLQKLIQNQR